MYRAYFKYVQRNLMRHVTDATSRSPRARVARIRLAPTSVYRNDVLDGNRGLTRGSDVCAEHVCFANLRHAPCKWDKQIQPLGRSWPDVGFKDAHADP